MTEQERLPLVSILCDTYNHEKYIAQAIDGFLMQKTNFPFEIIIHDDASTDNTAQIIRAYKAKYPELIFPIYQTINLFSNKEINIWADITFPKARGKYIALCEGDDYWTDSLKLQKQVDLLNLTNNFSAVFHDAMIVDGNGTEVQQYYPKPKRDHITTKEMLWKHHIPTCSFMFRRELLELIDFRLSKDILGGDRFLELSISLFGPIAYLGYNMCAHRKHSNGITNSKDHQLKDKRLKSNLKLPLSVLAIAKAYNKNCAIFYPKIATSHISLALHYLKSYHLRLCLTHFISSIYFFIKAPLEFYNQRVLRNLS